jgi:hypothetical protein
VRSDNQQGFVTSPVVRKHAVPTSFDELQAAIARHGRETNQPTIRFLALE